jgi:hypothetical protein
MVRGTVEETLNAMLDAEADRLCGAGRTVRDPITDGLSAALGDDSSKVLGREN